MTQGAREHRNSELIQQHTRSLAAVPDRSSTAATRGRRAGCRAPRAVPLATPRAGPAGAAPGVLDWVRRNLSRRHKDTEIRTCLSPCLCVSVRETPGPGVSSDGRNDDQGRRRPALGAAALPAARPAGGLLARLGIGGFPANFDRTNQTGPKLATLRPMGATCAAPEKSLNKTEPRILIVKKKGVRS